MPTYELTMSDGTTRRVTANSPQEAQAQVMSEARAMAAPRKLSSRDEGFINEARDAAMQAQPAARAADEFYNLNQQHDTGGFFRNIPILGGAIMGVEGSLVPARERMETLNNLMAPSMRIPGSGTTTQPDMELYKRSIPNRALSRETNNALVRNVKGNTELLNQYAEFLEAYAQRTGSTQGALAAWNKSLRQGANGVLARTSPLRPEGGPQYKPTQKPRVQYTPQQMQALRLIEGGPRGAGGSRTNPTMVMNKAQFDKLPAGTWFIDNFGNYEQKVR